MTPGVPGVRPEAHEAPSERGGASGGAGGPRQHRDHGESHVGDETRSERRAQAEQARGGWGESRQRHGGAVQGPPAAATRVRLGLEKHLG